MHRLASRGPCDPGAWTLSDSRMTRLRAGWQGVPVVLPVREGSPGGSYGTADERHLPCPAVFPAGVRLTAYPTVPIVGRLPAVRGRVPWVVVTAPPRQLPVWDLAFRKGVVGAGRRRGCGRGVRVQ